VVELKLLREHLTAFALPALEPTRLTLALSASAINEVSHARNLPGLHAATLQA
jgi:hypothetical protein